MREEAEKYHRENGEQPVLTEEDMDIILQNIISKTNIGGLGTLEELKDDPNFTFYIGLTKRTLEEEALRWLTARGKTGGGTNRPVLVHPNGENITMKTAEDDFGFQSQFLYKNSLLLNASLLEDCLQENFNDLVLGSRKLWRCVAKGKSSDKEDVEEKNVYKVFITYSTKVVEALKKGTMKIQKGEPPKGEPPKKKPRQE